MAESGTEPAALGPLQAALDRERDRAREIDHRANNNLQLVSALLLLFGRRADPATRQVLRAMQQRIGAIAAAQREALNADRFDLAKFIREYVATLVQGRNAGAEVRLELETVELAAGKAAPLALIVNELVLNALEHGAPSGRAAAATLRLQKSGEGFILTVEDHGPGLPPDAAEAGFGMSVVKLLAKQIAAQAAWEDAQPGVRAVVTAS